MNSMGLIVIYPSPQNSEQDITDNASGQNIANISIQLHMSQ
uniref:Uncharacterized protein n=1 Tax=Anguilla anguilla TaxID=7936 RepID=A0A0E9T3B0_ANGAN